MKGNMVRRVGLVAVSLCFVFGMFSCAAIKEVYEYDLMKCSEVRISSMASGKELMFSGADCESVVKLFENISFHKEKELKTAKSDGGGVTYSLLFYDSSNTLIARISLASIHKNEKQNWGVYENKYLYLPKDSDLNISPIKLLLGEKLL